MRPTVVSGDLLDQDVDVIVNAWNRNIIPWLLLIPAGVAGAIRRRAGTAPFRELAKTGPLPLGEARLTGAGKLPFQGIIHVAGISLAWRSSERSIRDSTRNAVRLADANGFGTMALPVIGGGTGGTNVERALGFMLEELEGLDGSVRVLVVKFDPDKAGPALGNEHEP